MPTIKKDKKTVVKVAKKAKSEDIVEEIAVLDEPADDELQPDEELDPEVIEALKLKNKKPKKAAHETDYIPELERGEIDLDFKMDEDY
jgi:hypothetical protein